jgi:hypothetical protein
MVFHGSFCIWGVVFLSVCVICYVAFDSYVVSIFSCNPAKKKAKAVPLHTTEAPGGESRYNSYSFFTSALDGGEWSASRPGLSLAPGKGPTVAIVQEAGWAPEPV